MTSVYMHRGLLNGQGGTLTGPAPQTLTGPVRIPNGTATVEYRRTNWFRDGARIYMPAAMVADDGTVTP